MARLRDIVSSSSIELSLIIYKIFDFYWKIVKNFIDDEPILFLIENTKKLFELNPFNLSDHRNKIGGITHLAMIVENNYIPTMTEKEWNE